MNRFLSAAKQFAYDKGGVSAIEYALIGAFIAVAVVLGFGPLANLVQSGACSAGSAAPVICTCDFLRQPQVQAAFVGVSGVLLGLYVNWRVIIAQRTHARKSVVTAIRSDIRSIVQALDMIGLVSSFVNTLRSPKKAPEFPPWSDSPREENYFKLYEALTPQIGIVDQELAKEVVRFYTFLRISRDAAHPFSTLREKTKPSGHPFSTLREKTKPSGDHKRHAANVLRALREALKSAAFVLSKECSPSKVNDAGQSEALQMVQQINQALCIGCDAL
ncbi:Flp pilus assembly pilin Flp [Oxalobacteraceae bacterium GrIS 1.11]